MYLMHNFFIFVTALFFSLIMVPAVRRWAIDTGAVDAPGERKIHDRTIPRAGGIAIFIPFLFSLMVYSEMTREIRGILAGALILFFTGLIDDLYGLTPRQKFFGQSAGCLVGILVGHLYLSRLGNLFSFGDVVLPLWLAIPFSVFAVVGVTNSFNLIDGLDGLAAGIGVIALSAFFLLGLQDSNFTVLSLSAGLLGGLLGFLRYNSFPARIFMGDTGSLVIGFVTATLAISLTQFQNSSVTSTVPLMILGLPIADAVFVVFSRLVKGQNPLLADKSHFHHKILSFFSDHRLSVLWIYGVNLFWTLIALLMKNQRTHTILVVFLLAILVNYSTLKLLQRYKDVIWQEFTKGFSEIKKSRVYLFLIQLDRVIGFVLIAWMLFFTFLSALVCESNSIVFLCLPVFMLCFFGLQMCEFNRNTEEIILLTLYLTGVVIIFFLEQMEETVLFSGFTVNFLTNFTFLMISLLVALKFICLKNNNNFFETPNDFLIISMSLALAVVSTDVDYIFHVSGSVSKGIILFLAIKVLAISRRIHVQAWECKLNYMPAPVEGGSKGPPVAGPGQF